ncbi:uncharacterized protein [Rutidosis leptorrhynchoides]|uniref:uncharacterized protein n=1 Tax=Rutidosis leptorrhynchoides TaxID=125765 RepID=UPI003A98ED00
MVVVFQKRKNALWVKIIRSIYGKGGGLDTNITCRNISGRTIWKEIIKAGTIADDTRASFSTSITKQLENGESIKFWKDIWCGSERFCTLFHRIFMLGSNKDAHVADRISHNGTSTCGIWSWIRSPSGRALNELTEINNIVSSIKLTDKPDAWKYDLDPSGIYTTKSLARKIDCLKLGNHATNISVPRNKYIPQKVNIFAWRVAQKKIPVRIELDKRGIDLNTVLCLICNSDIESTDHTMVHCPKIAQIWFLTLNWWNQPTSIISNLEDAISNQ